MNINNNSYVVDGTYLVANGFAKSWNNAKNKSEVKKTKQNRKVQKTLETSQYDFHI